MTRAISGTIALVAGWAVLACLQVVALAASPTARASAVLFSGTVVICTQVGQATGIQTTLGGRLPLRRAISGYIACIALAVAAVTIPAATAFLIGASAVATAGMGFVLAARLAPLLTPSGRLAYQTILLVRNATWMLLVALALVLELPITVTYVGSAFAAFGVAYYLAGIPLRGTGYDSASVPLRDRRCSLIPILGVAAALLYRNDVNFLRASLVTVAPVAVVHVGLIGYSACMGIAGVVVTQFVFPSLNSGRLSPSVLRSLYSRSAIPLASITVACGVFSVLASSPSHKCVLGIMAATPAGLLLALLSSEAHFSDRSTTSYLVGVISFLAFLLFMRRYPFQALALENVVNLAILHRFIHAQRAWV